MRIYLLLVILLPTVATPPLAAALRPTGPPMNNPYSDLNSTPPLILAVVVPAAVFTGLIAVCILHCYSGADRAIPLHTAAASRCRRLSPNGLDPAALNSFPIFNYSEIKNLKTGNGGELSCAVCVSEFEDNERLRLLPKCDHVFHSECIDLWLASHYTCPICRASLTQGTESTQSAAEECNSRPELSEAQNENQISITVDGISQRMGTEPRERARMLPRPHSTGHSLVRLGEDWNEMSDLWFLTLTPPFISRSGAKVGAVDGEIAAVGASRVFLTSVKPPFACLASKTEHVSTGLPV